MANMIRNISQTAQEREIVKTAPDIVVYIEGLPYLQNQFVNDRRTGQAPSIVNFNDHVTAFNCTYDTDLMIPSGTIGLQIPNHQKYQYQMPGGNNLIQPMMQIQVYAKAYFMSAEGDTVYRRMFKGLISHVGYNDNGKTFEVSIQCYGILYMLELMQVNLNPSMLTVAATGSKATYYTTRFAMLNPYKQIAAAFTYGLAPDGFQLNNLTQTAASNGQFGKAVKLGYINKWQSILTNLTKDVHIYGTAWKDGLSKDTSKTKESSVKGTADLAKQADQNTVKSDRTEVQETLEDMYYAKIRDYLPDRQVADVSLTNNQIVNRMELIRKMVHLIDFEAYQDVDGKIIVKPPLYNLDVLNLGSRVKQTSTKTGDRQNSYTNPLTAIYPESNPFVINLAEILTEQESEDQAAVRRTRTTVSGNVSVGFQFGYNEQLLPTAEYIDIPKLIKYGLREEPVINTPWFPNGSTALFAHAVAETVRANRGYRTYTVTIPLRPELKLGFPIFFPHRDMYGYVKSIAVNYQVGATATMTVTCDSIRRRVLVNTTQKDANNQDIELFTSAPNLVFKWATAPVKPQPAPGQSPSVDNSFLNSMSTGLAQGGFQPNGQPVNLTDPRGVAVTIPDSDTKSLVTKPTDEQNSVFNRKNEEIGNHSGMKTDSSGAQFAQYYIQNDGESVAGTIPDKNVTLRSGAPATRVVTNGYFTGKRPVDDLYFEDIKENGVIPYTDEKGYELISPFPWGRWVDLNSAIKEFTENGWVNNLADANGNPIVNPQEEIILRNTDAFLYAGLGTPTAQGAPADVLNRKFAEISNTVGGSFAASDPSKPNTLSLDATVLVLKYQSGSSNDDQLLKTPQPEDDLIQNQIKLTENTQQRLVDVLVSGQIAPTKLSQEALKATQTQTPLNTNSIGSTPKQQAQQAEELAGTPPSDNG